MGDDALKRICEHVGADCIIQIDNCQRRLEFRCELEYFGLSAFREQYHAIRLYDGSLNTNPDTKVPHSGFYA